MTSHLMVRDSISKGITSGVYGERLQVQGISATTGEIRHYSKIIK
jgi:hypothetical protein